MCVFLFAVFGKHCAATFSARKCRKGASRDDRRFGVASGIGEVVGNLLSLRQYFYRLPMSVEHVPIILVRDMVWCVWV